MSEPNIIENLLRPFFNASRHSFLLNDLPHGFASGFTRMSSKSAIVIIVNVSLKNKVPQEHLVSESRKMSRKIYLELEKSYKLMHQNATIIKCINPSLRKLRKIGSIIKEKTLEASDCVIYHYFSYGIRRLSKKQDFLWMFHNKKNKTTRIYISEISGWSNGLSLFVLDAKGAENMPKIINSSRSFTFICNRKGDRGEIFYSCMNNPAEAILKINKPRLFSSTKNFLEDFLADKEKIVSIQRIIDCVSECVAWSCFSKYSQDAYVKLFCTNSLLSMVSRRYFFFLRCVYKKYGRAVESDLGLSDFENNFFWGFLDYSCEKMVCYYNSPGMKPPKDPPDLEFFKKALVSFQNEISFETAKKQSFLLPVLAHILKEPTMSKRLVEKAINMLSRFLDKGSWAVHTAKSIGFYPLVLSHLESFRKPSREDLLFICAKFLSVENKLIKPLIEIKVTEKLKSNLGFSVEKQERKAVGFYLLSAIYDGFESYKDFENLRGVVNLKRFLLSSSKYLRWWCLMMFSKLWERFPPSKEESFNRSVHRDVLLLLGDECPEVRAAAVYSLGIFTSCYTGRSEGKNMTSDVGLCKKIAECGNDGSPFVRAQVLLALIRFFMAYKKKFTSKQNLRESKKVEKIERSKTFILETLKRMQRDSFPAISFCAKTTIMKSTIGLLKSISVEKIRKGTSEVWSKKILKENPDNEISLNEFDFYEWSNWHFSQNLLTNRVLCAKDLSQAKNTIELKKNYRKKLKSKLPEKDALYDTNYSALRSSTICCEQRKIVKKFYKILKRVPRDVSRKMEIYSKLRHRPLVLSDSKWKPTRLRFHPFGPFLIGANEHGFITVWNLKSNAANFFRNSNSHESNRLRITDFVLLGNFPNTLLSVTGNGTARVWKNYHIPGKQRMCASFRPLEKLGSFDSSGKSFVRCSWHPNLSHIYFAGTNGKVALWDVSVEKLVRSFNLPLGDFASTMFADSEDECISFIGTNAGYLHAVDARAHFGSNSRFGNNITSSRRLYNSAVVKVQINKNKMLTAGRGDRVLISDARYMSRGEVGGTKKSNFKCKTPLEIVAAHDSVDLFACADSGESARIFNYNGKEISSVNHFSTTLGGLSKTKKSEVTAMAFHRHFPILAVAGKMARVSVFTNFEVGKNLIKNDGENYVKLFED